MNSYAVWLADRARTSNPMQVHNVLIPAGERQALAYRRLLTQEDQQHLAPAFRQRLVELEATLATLRGAQAA